jgi:Tfp pilus assembly protein PilN
VKAVNLIPTEHRRARPTGSKSGGAYAVVGVLGLLLVMAVMYVMTANSLNERETKAEEARQEADALEKRADQLGTFTNFASIKQQRLASVVTTAQTRFDWERMIRELSRVMPEGSWLQSADASVTGDAEDAADAAVPGAVVAPAPSATLIGCTLSQSEVAKLMVRMESMHRVTDVELNDATREQGATATTLDSCGKLYQFNLTVNFEGTRPASEAPRGANSVPASLGGGS